MRIAIRHRFLRIFSATSIEVARGQTFEAVLFGADAVAPIEWAASNDEVLSIVEDGGTSGDITATSVGVSKIYFKSRGREMGMLHVTVYKDTTEEAVRFSAEVGPELPK